MVICEIRDWEAAGSYASDKLGAGAFSSPTVKLIRVFNAIARPNFLHLE